MRQTFCPQFSVAVGNLVHYIFLYNVAIDLNIYNMVFQICFLITKLRKNTLRCARTLSEASWLSTLEHLPQNSGVWRSIHIPTVAVSKKPHT